MKLFEDLSTLEKIGLSIFILVTFIAVISILYELLVLLIS